MSTENEPFGRQPKPVTVVIQDGEAVDLSYWRYELQRYCSGRADTQMINHQSFRIFPRANND